MPDSSMPVYEAMRTLRAVRRLREDPIPDDVLSRILQAAVWAPSGGNIQPWRVIVLKDSVKRQQIGDLYKPQWQGFEKSYRKGLAGLEGEALKKQERILAASNLLGDNLGKAPVLLVFCFNPKLMAITDAGLDRQSVVGGGSVYPAVENLMLACVNEGVGCTLTTLLCIEEVVMKDLLDIPEDWHTCAVIPLGYPRGKGHGPIARRPVEKMCFSDSFGQPLTI